jgi:hypothetical protein
LKSSFSSSLCLIENWYSFACFLTFFFLVFFCLVFIAIEGYSQDGEFSQSQGQVWSHNSPWMTCSQPQFQHISPQMHVSNYDQFGAGLLELPCLSGSNLHQFVASSARLFLPLGMPRSSDSDLQQLCEEGTPSENVRNTLRDVKEEEAIITAVLHIHIVPR